MNFLIGFLFCLICTFAYSFYCMLLFFLRWYLRTTLRLCVLWTGNHSICKFYRKSNLTCFYVFNLYIFIRCFFPTFILLLFTGIFKKLFVFFWFVYLLICFSFILGKKFLIFDLIYIFNFTNWWLSNTLH
jgi:hypothetical protein